MRADKRKADLLLDGLMTVKEVAEYLAVDRHVVEDMAKSGELPHVRLGPRQTRIPRRALYEFLAERMRGAA